ERVDQHLFRDDVRLTVGGEPTFVSIDDREGSEWNSTAVGPTKRMFADDLIRRLRARFAPGGMLHYAEGKWYPGDSVPRWAFSLFWRKDGEPVWHDAKLIATEAADHTATADDARRFAEGIAAELGIPREYVLPAFEDLVYSLAQETQLPLNIDPTDPKLAQPEERAKIMRSFALEPLSPVAFILPLKPSTGRLTRSAWISEQWQLRRAWLFIVPGDATVGSRLPLSSLPRLDPTSYPH